MGCLGTIIRRLLPHERSRPRVRQVLRWQEVAGGVVEGGQATRHQRR